MITEVFYRPMRTQRFVASLFPKSDTSACLLDLNTRPDASNNADLFEAATELRFRCSPAGVNSVPRATLRVRAACPCRSG